MCLLVSEYLVMHTHQRSSLTAQIHHNSQKRINISNLFWVLADLTLTQQTQKHPSAALCLQQWWFSSTWDPSTQIVFYLSSFFYLYVDFCYTCQSYWNNATHGSFSSLPRHMQHYIKDNLTIFIQLYHQGRLIGGVSPNVWWEEHRHKFTYGALQQRWIFFTFTILSRVKASLVKQNKSNSKAMPSLTQHEKIYIWKDT